MRRISCRRVSVGGSGVVGVNVGAVGDRVSVSGLSVVGMNAGAVGLSVICCGDVFVNCARPALSAAIIAVLMGVGEVGFGGCFLPGHILRKMCLLGIKSASHSLRCSRCR